MQNTSMIELEHSIGYSGNIPQCVHIHPNGTDLLYISNACIVVTDLRDPHL